MTHSETVHFVGVGGVGMSGIAAIASRLGMKVSGSDMKASRYTQQLVDAGVEVHIGHAAQNVPEDCDVVVASTAIPETNPDPRGRHPCVAAGGHACQARRVEKDPCRSGHPR